MEHLWPEPSWRTLWTTSIYWSSSPLPTVAMNQQCRQAMCWGQGLLCVCEWVSVLVQDMHYGCVSTCEASDKLWLVNLLKLEFVPVSDPFQTPLSPLYLEIQNGIFYGTVSLLVFKFLKTSPILSTENSLWWGECSLSILSTAITTISCWEL